MKETVMSVRLYRESDEKRWEEYVAGSANATTYHQLGWKRVIEKSFGHRTHYLLSEDANLQINGILPLVQLKSFIFGNFFVSLPYFNYGGICTDRVECCGPLLQKAIQIANEEGATHLELRETAPLEGGLSFKMAKVAMKLTLPASPEALWQSFSPKLRSQIRRPQKEGFSVRIGQEAELDAFYQVFSTNMKDLGTPVYSKQFFREILRAFTGSTTICVVYNGTEPVAAAFLVGFKETLEIPWASSLRDYNRLAPNMLLYWSVLSFAIEHGYRFFDFGRSTPGEGTYQFKAQWGATPTPLYWHYWLRTPGPLPEINPKNKKYRAAIEIWKRLPLPITRLIGPCIVRNIP
jgi:serine/alanine adding enzyme